MIDHLVEQNARNVIVHQDMVRSGTYSVEKSKIPKNIKLYVFNNGLGCYIINVWLGGGMIEIKFFVVVRIIVSSDVWINLRKAMNIELNTEKLYTVCV